MNKLMMMILVVFIEGIVCQNIGETPPPVKAQTW